MSPLFRVTSVIFSFTFVTLSLITFNSSTALPKNHAASGPTYWLVTNANDSGAGSLRNAIDSAAYFGDVIYFANAQGGYLVNMCSSYMYSILLHSPLLISKSVDIEGAKGCVFISGGSDITGYSATNIFNVQNGGIVLDSIDMGHGKATAGNGGLIQNLGGSVNLNNCLLEAGEASNGQGGAIYNTGSLTVNRSEIDNSTADGTSLISGDGGGIYNNGGSVIIKYSKISGNTSNANALVNQLPGSPYLAGGGGAVFNKFGNVTISYSTINGNTATSISQLDGFGGAIANDHGSLNIDHTTIANNTANYGGGGIINSDRFTLTGQNPSITISDTTIANNIAISDGGAIVDELIGGSFTINNSTLGQNHAMTQSSVTSPPGGHDIYIQSAGLSLNNSLVEGNGSGSNTNDCVTGTLGQIGNNQYSLENPSVANQLSCGFSQTYPQVPFYVFGLSNNGGPTLTMALNLSIPSNNTALDYIPTSGCNVSDDQRGIARPYPAGGKCDAGAYEYDPRYTNVKVTTTADADDGNCTQTICTLRDAINYSPPGSTITFASGVTGKIQLTLGELTIANYVIITGPTTSPGITIDGGGVSRVFHIKGSGAILNNLTIQKGYATADTNGDLNYKGGGIYDDEAGGVSINNSTFYQNTALNSGGAIFCLCGSGKLLNVVNSTFYQNTAQSLGIAPTAYTSAVGGGAIYNASGGMFVVNSTFDGNSSPAGGATLDKGAGTFDIVNTIIANSGGDGANCGSSGAYNDGGNLEYPAASVSCYTGNPPPNPAPSNPVDDSQGLVNKGGPTGVLPIASGSVAKNGGRLSYCQLLLGTSPECYIDQRGYPRRGAYDSGSFAASTVADTVGVYRQSGQSGGNTFYLRRSNTTGYADLTVPLNFSVSASSLPVVGNWTANATYNGLGVFDPTTSTWYLCNKEAPCSTPDFKFIFGKSSDLPLAGHWALSDQTDGVGVFRPSNGIMLLTSVLPAPQTPTPTATVNYQIVLGMPGDLPVMGDWNVDGVDTPGVYRNSTITFYLSDDTTPYGNPQLSGTVVNTEYTFQFGANGATYWPIAGDWSYPTFITDGVGLFNGGVFLKNQPTTGTADNQFTYGLSTDLPIAGYWWNGVGSPKPPPSVLVPSTPIPVVPGSGNGQPGLGD